MKKLIILLAASSTLAVQKINAQSTDNSTSKTMLIAKLDAKKLKISNDDLRKFDTLHPSVSSDYFKPTPDVASEPALLKDSAYVQAFKKEAFSNTLNIQSITFAKERSKISYTAPAQIIAKKDAENFTMGKSLLKKFKKEHFAYTSDYFKPTAKTTSDPSMLNDTTYVSTFRYEAYDKARHQRLHPVGHDILVGLSVVVSVAIIGAGIYELNQY